MYYIPDDDEIVPFHKCNLVAMKSTFEVIYLLKWLPIVYDLIPNLSVLL